MKGDYRDLKLPPGTKVLTTRLPAEFGGPAEAVEAPKPVASRGRPKARYTKPRPGEMNKLEARYANHLKFLKDSGDIFDFAFEPEKFRLALQGDKCFYTPDFRVLLNDGGIEFHETKGWMEEDANIKAKWFVQQHPYPLVIVKWVKGAWEYDRREP